jgi:hypothetical protein
MSSRKREEMGGGDDVGKKQTNENRIIIHTLSLNMERGAESVYIESMACISLSLSLTH